MDDKLRLARWTLSGIITLIMLLLLVAVTISRVDLRSTQDVSILDQPALTPREFPKTDRKRAESSEQAATSYRHATEKEPLSIKLIPSVKTEAEARKEKYETQEKPDLDRGMTKYIYFLFIATVLLVVAAIIQAVLFFGNCCSCAEFWTMAEPRLRRLE